MNKLHIDVETFSSLDIRQVGAYRYCEAPDFEIILFGYAINDEPAQIIDLLQGEQIPQRVLDLMHADDTEIHAHNATFERRALIAHGFNIPIERFRCTMVKAAYCGLPLSLDEVSKALDLGEMGKKAEGKKLIQIFCTPTKPTKTNNMATRTYPHDEPVLWEDFKEYCRYDVIAERIIEEKLEAHEICEFERKNYILDQIINDKGVKVERELAQKCYDLDLLYSDDIMAELRVITGLENPNSPAQIKNWLSDAMGKEIKSLAKDILPVLLEEAESDAVRKVIKLRKKSSKASTKKYAAMLNCICEDDRVRGLLQFYGANRTGRWAGRLVQLQNLPQNKIDEIERTRALVFHDDYETIKLMYSNVSDVLSQLVRTTFVADTGHTFAIADFSAIEARVVAWLAGEQWRIDVFNSHGKIYEASASKMFNVPIEQVTKGSDLRAKGKNAELALGYQGAVGAMLRLGADKMGMSEEEMKIIVKKWRASNRQIVKFWEGCENAAVQAVKTRTHVETRYPGISFSCDDMLLKIHLPSGRYLSYFHPRLEKNRFGTMAIKYRGVDQITKKWTFIDTYGGKIVENIVQAVSRDILAHSMMRLYEEGYTTVMHIHDEVVVEIKNDDAENDLKRIEAIMGEDIPWAKGLPLNADGYLSEFYKKD